MIRHWTVLNLEVFRRFASDSGVRFEIQDNGDGTHFIAYDIRSFPPELIIDLSPTMQTALTDGVDAVKPLRSKIEAELDNRWREHCARDPPPDLQELVRRSGGHNKITPEAWADFDQQKEDWNRRHFRQWRNTI